MANTYLSVRVDESDKQKASAVLEELGTNLSSVVNMLLKQIIITESVPFEIAKQPYSKKEMINEVVSSMRMEGMYLTEDEADFLEQYQKSDVTARKMIKDQLLQNYKEAR